MYDNDGKKIKQFTSSGGDGHAANFIKAVRSRAPGDLNAQILGGHISSVLHHAANISHRLGHTKPPEQIREIFKDRPDILETYSRFEQHIIAHNEDPEKKNPVIGPWLYIDEAKESFVSNETYDTGFWANQLLKGSYRYPFVLPKKI